MKSRMAMLSYGIVLVLSLSGCTSVRPVNANAWARDYYNQPNVAPVVSIKGDNVRISVEGARELTLSTPVPTKSIIPREAGVMDAIGNLAGRILPWIVAGYIGHEALDTRVVEPQVVTTEKLVPVEGAAP